MTDRETIELGYGYFRDAIKRTYLDVRPEERTKYCKVALSYARMFYEAYINSIDAFEDLSDKTANLLMTMKEHSEWLFFLMEAMGEDKDMIIAMAKKYKEVSDKAAQRKIEEKRD